MIIAGHNKKLLNSYYQAKDREQRVERLCNCRVNMECPLNGNCLKMDVLYKAKCLADDEPTKDYIGITATTFKVRHTNNTSSFRNQNYSQATTLSSYFWKMKTK